MKLDIYIGGIYLGKLESAVEDVETNYEINLRMFTGSFKIYGSHVKLDISAVTEDGGSWQCDTFIAYW